AAGATGGGATSMSMLVIGSSFGGVARASRRVVRVPRLHRHRSVNEDRPMLRVRTVGGLALEVDGVERPVPPGRPGRLVLAWLAPKPRLHARSPRGRAPCARAAARRTR